MAAILHVYAGGLIFMTHTKKIIIFQKVNENAFPLLIIFIVKSLKSE